MAKENDKFTFEMIASVYREEHNSITLTKLPVNFYKQLTTYIEELNNSYLDERNKDPPSPKTIMLEDEYNKAQKRAQQIYELRERKIVKAALSKANGGDPNLKFMTDEEKNAFNTIVETLKKNRSAIMLEKKDNSCTSKTFLISNRKAAEVEAKNELDEINSANIEKEKNEKEGSELFIDDLKQEDPVLLILEDVPSFETEERSFDLKKNDTITLPKKFAKILCKHKKARVIGGYEKNL
ncbi:MAG: DNA replication complex GINS family protein [Methanomassiliicoccales archaeon]|nr:MAG: DNA replication complex GINS family protein [Methanomassiliicoccales archaeon]